ncbi:MAG: polysaccharide deacetylase family protein [Verrucomicrobiota bacterium]
MKHLIVSLHDFHPGSREAVAEQVKFMHEIGVSCFSVLVVPRFHMGPYILDDQASLAFLDERYAAGDEMVIHGYYHYVNDPRPENIFWNRLYTNRESEFFDLSDGEVRHRVDQGLQVWHQQGWQVKGFIPPAWLMPDKQNAILKKMGLTYTNRLKTITLLQKKKTIAAQSLCYSARAAWRRTLSLSWNQALFNRLRKTDTIRLSLHPDDLKYTELQQQIGEITEMALADGFTPITYARYASL